MKDQFPHKVTIMWGECPEEGDVPRTYSFETEAELHAFKMGIEEMNGWMGYHEIEEGQYYSFEDRAVMTKDDADGKE